MRKDKASLIRNAIPIFGFILVCEMAGIIGSLFTFSAIPTWYATLAKPSFSPPNWVFGPVWTTLYALMGISAYMIWKTGWHKKEVKKALCVFAIQLLLNATWSIVFFGMKNPGLALINIALLWAGIVASILLFSRVSRNAALLLSPYLLWVSFASVLNFYIWMLN